MQPAEICLLLSPGNMNQSLFGEHVDSSVKHSTHAGAAEPRGAQPGEPAPRRPAEPSGEGAETGLPRPWAGADSHLGGARLMEVASGWPVC